MSGYYCPLHGERCDCPVSNYAVRVYEAQQIASLRQRLAEAEDRAEKYRTALGAECEIAGTLDFPDANGCVSTTPSVVTRRWKERAEAAEAKLGVAYREVTEWSARVAELEAFARKWQHVGCFRGTALGCDRDPNTKPESVCMGCDLRALLGPPAEEKCPACGGSGNEPGSSTGPDGCQPCDKCNGTGRKDGGA